MSVANTTTVADQRRTPRHEVSFTAALLRDHQPRLAVHIVDISLNGLMARPRAALRNGEPVLIDLPFAGKREAIVRWALGGRMGAELAKPLPEAVCRRIVSDPPPPPSPWLRF